MSDFKLIESKWQKYWEEHPEISRADDFLTGSVSVKPKKYILVEFPYPSGSGLHIGHTFSFTGGDIYARFKRMQGYNVLFPMGWDAFGLPTENYAIKMKRNPKEITKENIDMFRNQMKKLAFSFDWDREVDTTDPKYYRWTQWIFIQLFKKGLAYKKEMPINWCPSCKIGLANEEVVEGRCERCGEQVSRKNISQWIVKITDYASNLIEGLKETNFIDKVKQSQINWIGESEGAKIKFQISEARCQTKELEVFTTRPDTLFGVTFIVLAPEHPLVSELLACDEFLSCLHSRNINSMTSVRKNSSLHRDIEEYVVSARKKSDMERTELNKEKTGVFSGLYAINPVNNKKIPIWISDFVSVSYGTGAIMSVPAHDERDFEFAKKFGLEIIPVVSPVYSKVTGKQDWDFSKKPYTNIDKGEIINSLLFDGMIPSKAGKIMIKWLIKKKIGKKSVSYHLRDWIFSRQHYWGEPIPMMFCKTCAKHHLEGLEAESWSSEERKIKEMNVGWIAVSDNQLPVVLPEVEAYEPTDDGKSPLSKIDTFLRCKCPVCGQDAVRETDTMPNWAGSDWYYLAYCFANKLGGSFTVNDIFSDNINVLKYWGPVDIYIGGDEHNVLHLLYSRFVYKFLRDLGVLPKKLKEPYFRRISHGVILGPDGQRMSKSKGNVIVPETVADRYGVDVLRMYLMFMGPFDSTMAWNENTLMGVKRFLDRFNQFIRFQISNIRCQKSKMFASSQEVKLIINKLIKAITDDFESFRYNTAIAKMMEALNSLSICKVEGEDVKTLIKLIAPLAPYTAEELWISFFGITKNYISVHRASWPVVEEKYLTEDIITIPVAINGKVKSQITIGSSQKSDKVLIMKMTKEDEKVKRWLSGGQIVKEIYVVGKMINFVVK